MTGHRGEARKGAISRFFLVLVSFRIHTSYSVIEVSHLMKSRFEVRIASAVENRNPTANTELSDIPRRWGIFYEALKAHTEVDYFSFVIKIL